MTWIKDRPWCRVFDDMKIRLAAIFPFTSIARVVDTNYEERSIVVNFESEEFWATPNLENWSSARSESLCHSIWHNSSDLSVFERVQAMHLVLTAIPQNLAIYVHSLVQHLDIILRNEFWQHLGYGGLEVLESLKFYYFEVEMLLTWLEQSVEVLILVKTVPTVV
ncbi:hypothetical protein B0H13DRAFT_1908297 [Mycena leptocephala]|nr:hypothetical protein B0H13DRAFT_1908297 [Mycena leptocephala]